MRQPIIIFEKNPNYCTIFFPKNNILKIPQPSLKLLCNRPIEILLI